MTRAQLRTAGIALLVLLACPRPGNAGILSIIWEMSGPRMYGIIVFHCEYDLQNDNTECSAVDKRVFGAADARAKRRIWVSLDAAVYTSGDHDSDDAQYDAFENHMIAFEPMLHVQVFRSPGGDFSLHHGLIGLTDNFLFGKKFKSFSKVGLKFTPFAFTYKRLNFTYDVRVYPDGFTAADFGAGPLPADPSRRRETTRGLSIGILLGRN